VLIKTQNLCDSARMKKIKIKVETGSKNFREFTDMVFKQVSKTVLDRRIFFLLRELWAVWGPWERIRSKRKIPRRMTGI
jgi:hypothetical protein